MAPTNAAAPFNLGFLTILHEAGGYLGGYLVTNSWGRPLEFRLSTAVQPNRVQQILYAGTLQPYIFAELIGKTLVDKTTTAANLILTDREPALDLRLRVETPVVWLAPAGDALADSFARAGSCARPAQDARPSVLCHPRFPHDVAEVQQMLKRLDESFDPTEPFARIREAVAEARKMGVTHRG